MTEIIVQKFGGTSVGSVERIDAVAEIIKEASKSKKIIVVVSAMGGETNRLVKLAKHFDKDPDKRERIQQSFPLCYECLTHTILFYYV